MKIFLILLTLVVTFSFIIFGCEDISTEIDPEVHIINSYKSSLMGGSVIVKYQIENTVNTNINGWKVYFGVSLTNNQQVVASDQSEYNLETGEISKILTAICKLPEHFGSNVKPRTVVIKKLEVY